MSHWSWDSLAFDISPSHVVSESFREVGRPPIVNNQRRTCGGHKSPNVIAPSASQTGKTTMARNWDIAAIGLDLKQQEYHWSVSNLFPAKAATMIVHIFDMESQ
mmetsp:Transcript_22356/g.52684  ORF Transcript_22356/g.52684 Transcript_22356/m.52684 type:complete len:104 (+) Transcript_22356:217-528(+)